MQTNVITAWELIRELVRGSGEPHSDIFIEIDGVRADALSVSREMRDGTSVFVISDKE